MESTALRPHCRWMIARDLSEVAAIEQACFPVPWTVEDFKRRKGHGGTQVSVVETGRRQMLNDALVQLAKEGRLRRIRKGVYAPALRVFDPARSA